MSPRWDVDVKLVDANGMETFVNLQVTADDAEAAGEVAKQEAIDQMEFTGAHVSMTAGVEDEAIRPLAD